MCPLIGSRLPFLIIIIIQNTLLQISHLLSQTAFLYAFTLFLMHSNEIQSPITQKPRRNLNEFPENPAAYAGLNTRKAGPNQPGRWKDRFVQRVVCYYKGS